MGYNTIRQRVMAGETVLGSMVFEFFSPGIAQCFKNAGAEFIIYDMEHTGVGFESLKSQVSHCRGLNIAPMARVPRSDYHFLARALDIGATGVMIPMVESAEQATSIAEACRYPPAGRRGAAFGFAHDNYMAGSPEETMKLADQLNLVIAQIETERGLDAIDEIAAVDGIDVLWLGHFDMTNFLGIPGQFQHEKYLGAIEKIVECARRHGKGLGFMAANKDWMCEYQDHGFNMLACGTDQGLLISAASELLAAVRTREPQ